MNSRRLLTFALAALLVALQTRLWFGDGGLFALHRGDVRLAASTATTTTMRTRNATLLAEVDDLRKGGPAIEARARSELGMIRRGETFYLVVQ